MSVVEYIIVLWTILVFGAMATLPFIMGAWEESRRDEDD